MKKTFYRSKNTERHLKLWIYLIPVFGVIPAIWTLYRSHKYTQANLAENREQQKVSRLALTLALVWLSSYSLLSLGVANASEIISFRLLYANALLTTAYFVTCTILMSGLGNKSLPKVDEVNKLN
ncbi:MAG: hypothetical protein QNJ72_13330 [Pleurocapsa sp. MO_226.B13]|nr:hypothetical protein [Pleurocapsa sp. MO_226.B13]